MMRRPRPPGQPASQATNGRMAGSAAFCKEEEGTKGSSNRAGNSRSEVQSCSAETKAEEEDRTRPVAVHSKDVLLLLTETRL